LDVAVERRVITRAVRRAAQGGAARQPARIADPAAWGAAHRPLLEDAPADLAPIVERFAALAGASHAAWALALVAAIPTSPRPFPVAERAPIVTFMRRRADAEAKAVLALALSPREANGAVLLHGSGPLVRAALVGGEDVVWDLSAGVPRAVDGGDAPEALGAL
jgi:hypothetical protein